jgi:hypothetical protein
MFSTESTATAAAAVVAATGAGFVGVGANLAMIFPILSTAMMRISWFSTAIRAYSAM